jgi:hypothetical protein
VSGWLIGRDDTAIELCTSFFRLFFFLPPPVLCVYYTASGPLIICLGFGPDMCIKLYYISVLWIIKKGHVFSSMAFFSPFFANLPQDLLLWAVKMLPFVSYSFNTEFTSIKFHIFTKKLMDNALSWSFHTLTV